jgi:hypothetical protein
VFPQVASLPKFTSLAVQRHLKACVAPYNEFSTAFKDLDMEAVQKVLADNTEVFTQVLEQCRVIGVMA